MARGKTGDSWEKPTRSGKGWLLDTKYAFSSNWGTAQALSRLNQMYLKLGKEVRKACRAISLKLVACVDNSFNLRLKL